MKRANTEYVLLHLLDSKAFLDSGIFNYSRPLGLVSCTIIIESEWIIDELCRHHSLHSDTLMV